MDDNCFFIKCVWKKWRETRKRIESQYIVKQGACIFQQLQQQLGEVLVG